MSTNNLVKGAAILSIAGLIVKFLGAVFKIPLTALIGMEGMAYYGYAYPIYGLFLVIATAGIPVAISRLVSEHDAIEDYEGAYRVFKVSKKLLLAMGVVGFLIFILFADVMAENMFKDPGAALAIKAIAPALIFVPWMSAYRGFFQGKQDMSPTALSQFTEQIIRVAIGLGLAYTFANQSLEYAAAGATFGASAGAIAGLFTLWFVFRRRRNDIFNELNRRNRSAEVESNLDILKKVIIIAIPITLGASMIPIINLLDSLIVNRRLLDAGFTLEEARVLWGELSSYIATMVGFPQVLTQSVEIAIVPAIAGAFLLKKTEEVKENISLSLRMSALLGFPCMVGLGVLAEPILLLLFPSDPVTVHQASSVMRISAIYVGIYAIIQATNGILQGIDKQVLPMKNLGIAAIFKCIFTYIFVGIRRLNIMGASLGTLIFNIITLVLNMRDVIKYTGFNLEYKNTFIKPLVASLVMGGFAWGAFELLSFVLSSRVACLGGVFVGVVVYGVMVVVTGTITKDELALLPKGEKLIGLLDRFIK